MYICPTNRKMLKIAIVCRMQEEKGREKVIEMEMETEMEMAMAMEMEMEK